MTWFSWLVFDRSWLLLNVGAGSIFDAASPQAEKIRSLTNGFIVAGSAILLLVIVLTTYIVIRFRGKENDPAPKQTTSNRPLEIGMIAVPLGLVIGFFFWSLQTMNAVLPDHGDQKPDIVITGHQWFWEASYPGMAVTTANEIHLTVGKKLLMQLTSADVIHDWWVPALGGKMDMIPGTNNYLWVTISTPGIYEGACSEFCGQQHAWMRIRVVAQSADDYAKWLAREGAIAAPPVGKMARDGASLFVTSSCSSCHRIGGTTANGIQGPDLTHFASRETMLTGLMKNDSANIAAWLTDPQKVKPGAHMPRFIYPTDSIRALTAYLEQLK